MKTTMSSRKVKSLGKEMRERSVRLLLFLAITALASWLGATGAFAATVYVDVGNISGNEDGTASNPFNTIQEGISAAVSGDVVQIADGTYKGAGNRDLVLNGSIKNITIRSQNGPEKTIIDLEHSGRAFTFQGGSISTVDGLTIKNGYISEDEGGAIFIDDVDPNSPVITNCIFLDNTAQGGGGAIYVGLKPSSMPIIKNCKFSRNSATNSGGAIRVYLSNTDQSVGNGFLKITECNFSKNVSGAGKGGAVNVSGARTFITKSSFYENLALEGGALNIGVDDAALAVVIADCVFSNNKALARSPVGFLPSGGGAICVNQSSNIHIMNSAFFKNKAAQAGGAIHCENANVVPLKITQCTFAENEAKESGGAIHTRMAIDIYNSILKGNKAENGGSQIYLAANVIQGSNFNIGYSNLEGGLSGIGRAADNDMVIASPGGMIDLDPMFALQGDLHLMPGSPCIDSGNSDKVPVDQYDFDNDGNTTEPLPYDADGNSRILDGKPDMGAYEFDRTQFPVAAVTPNRFTFTARRAGPIPEGQTLFIRNRGLDTLGLNWKVTTDEENSWLRVEPSEGVSTGDIDAVRLYVDHTALSHGIYTCNLLITDTDSHILRIAEVTLYVTDKIRVPSTNYPTIQEAIYGAIEGDDVVLANGTYTGAGNKNLLFLGKNIRLKSENGPEYTIIDCEGDGRAFAFMSGETSMSIVQGLTIKHGNGDGSGISGFGGGIAILNSSPTILDCIFDSNSVGGESSNVGGAIGAMGGNPHVSNCRFLENSVAGGTTGRGYGGGIYGWPGISL